MDFGVTWKIFRLGQFVWYWLAIFIKKKIILETIKNLLNIEKIYEWNQFN